MTTPLARATRRAGFALRTVFIAYTGASTLWGLATAGGALVAVWAICHLAGGPHTPASHLFYLPIVLVAVRFAWPTVVATAVVAGLLAGPALQVNVSAASGLQRPEDWVPRLLMFVLVGSVLAWLVRMRHEPLRSSMQDSLSSARLVHAVRRGDITVHYQPLYRLADQHLLGFEALARWHDPRRGAISPGEFIPPAERTGAISVLDGYVLQTAAAQMRHWCDETRPLRLSVNISATRFKRGDLVVEVARALDGSGFPARSLQLEITESALIDNLGDAVEQIGHLRSLGTRIAIDDFGAGYASLGYLNHFEVDTIKLDRSFLVRATTDPRTHDLLAGVSRLLQGLDVEIVAEGIETTAQAELVHALGIQVGQGFLLGRPVSALETGRLLESVSDR